jgi:DNA (cytosine-5)-methyltransferase 1
VAAYYNEFDPFAAAWLRELIADGLIADGDIDERSILDVSADDLAGYDQCHFFAGIGGWSYALRLAGWPDERAVWTGSCPCQPLSSAGQRRGHADERHLWPAFYELIAECRPSTIFGEQVASRLGREWLAGVRADLEDLGYACGAADLCAAGVGAPHIRQRLWWLGDADSGRRDGFREPEHGEQQSPRGIQPDGSGAGRLWQGSYIDCTDGKARRIEPSIFPLAHGVPNRMGTLRGAGNAIVPQVAAVFVRATGV